MTQIRVNLSKEANKIIEIYKVNNDCKTKAEAYEKFVLEKGKEKNPVAEQDKQTGTQQDQQKEVISNVSI